MERLMQYVWQHRLWRPAQMTTVEGVPVDVLDPGLLNTASGPDFFNAKIRMGGQVWAGNIEIHVKASDWHRHGHDGDPAYANVMLHVVGKDDARIKLHDTDEIPQVLMPMSEDFLGRADALLHNPNGDLPCADILASMPQVQLSDWLTALAFERLHTKAERVLEYVERCNGDWQQAIFVTLARGLGFGINAEPFERLAMATPLRALLKHRDNITSLEAILLGQAGFLTDLAAKDALADPYAERLAAEYKFMTHKYMLEPLRDPGWKTAGMRPAGFPQRRIAILAAMVAAGKAGTGPILAIGTPDEARSYFSTPLEGYWTKHYAVGRSAERLPQMLGTDSLNKLILNVLLPVQMAYSQSRGGANLAETVTDILQNLPAESNAAIRPFCQAGINCKDAFTSQALLQLRRNYCEPRKCLYCRIGYRYLAKKQKPVS